MPDHTSEVEPSLIAAQAGDPELRSLLIGLAYVTEPAKPYTDFPHDAPPMARAIELVRRLSHALFILSFDRKTRAHADWNLLWVSLRFLSVAQLAKDLPVDSLTTAIRVNARGVVNAISPVTGSVGHDPRFFTERTARQGRAAFRRAYRLYGQDLERLLAELQVAIENGVFSGKGGSGDPPQAGNNGQAVELTPPQCDAFECIKNSPIPMKADAVAVMVDAEGQTVRKWCAKSGPLYKAGIRWKKGRGYFLPKAPPPM